MILKIMFFIIGFSMMTIGMAYIIVYSNLLTFGYSIKEYLLYIITRYECWYFIIGLIIITILIFRKGNNSVKRI